MTRSRMIALVLGMGIAGATGAVAQMPAQGPSFDCARASGQVEALICKDAELSALDRRMAEVHSNAMKAWPEPVAREQRAYQRGWIKGRDECWKEEDVRACTELSYRTRIAEFQIGSGQLQAPISIGYECSDPGRKPFTVSFYSETEPASAVITYGDDQVIAFRTPAASGAKYAASGVEFWEHQGEASVEWFGATLTCRPRKSPSALLAGTSWVLVQFQSMDDTTLRPEKGRRYALSFAEGGQLRLQADCNRGTGSWQSSGASLEFGGIALTRAMCPPSPIGERFVRDLGFVRSFVMRDGQLHLSLMADGGIYTFEPQR